MQVNFQDYAQRAITDFAQQHQLEPCPLRESGNGIEYKNYLSNTIFTVYHARLDGQNRDRIEIAVGADNIAKELSCSLEVVAAWLSEIQKSLHLATEKPPQYWPRLAIWSDEELQEFFRAVDGLFSAANLNAPLGPTLAVTTLDPAVLDEKVLREILTRRGQREFRSILFREYAGRCAITGCADAEVLEAAHLVAHNETQDYRITNGLLLRADVHTLFDLRLISIDPQTAEVMVSASLGETYQPLNGRRANLPKEPASWPDASALMRHFTQWQANER